MGWLVGRLERGGGCDADGRGAQKGNLKRRRRRANRQNSFTFKFRYFVIRISHFAFRFGFDSVTRGMGDLRSAIYLGVDRGYESVRRDVNTARG